MRFCRMSLMLALVAALANAQETGIKNKKPVFGGACKICPWGAVAEIVKAALQPYGDDVKICCNGATAEAPRIVAAARTPAPVERAWQLFPYIPPNQYEQPPKGPVDFGATSVQNLWWAYEGTHTYKGEEPRRNLRLIAVIQSPNYLIVAAKAELGITDLRQIKQKRWPVRILTDGSESTTAVLAYYGLTKESVESACGHVGRGIVPDESKNFDLAIHGGTPVK